MGQRSFFSFSKGTGSHTYTYETVDTLLQLRQLLNYILSTYTEQVAW